MTTYQDKLDAREDNPDTLPDNVVCYPDPRLRERATAIQEPAIAKAMADDMVRTMREAQGVGIAAQQVGYSQRIVIVAPTEEAEIIAINPRITAYLGGVKGEEGCLSIPGFRADVGRAEVITIAWTDLDGRHHSKTVGGFEAVIWQH